MPPPDDPRSLPVVLEPHHRETFESLIRRAAVELSCPVVTLIASTHPERSPDSVIKGYGFNLPRTRRRTFLQATNLTDEQIDGTLIETAFHGVLFDDRPSDTRRRRASHRTLQRRWVRSNGSFACPACLVDNGGIWDIAWKTGYQFGCPRHLIHLVDKCPSCNKIPMELGGRTTRTVPALDLCDNSLGPDRCECPISDWPTEPLTPDQQVVALAVDEMLNGGSGSVAGSSVDAPTWFRAVRWIATMAAIPLTEDDLDGLPGNLLPNASRYTTGNQRAREDRSLGVADRRIQTGGVSLQPLGIAAITIPAATRILDAPSAEESALLLADLLRTVGEVGPTSPSDQVDNSGADPELANVQTLALQHLLTVPALLGGGSRSERRTYSQLVGEHIPTGFWRSRWPRFQQYFADERPQLRRFLLSSIIVRRVTGMSAADAGKYLHFPFSSTYVVLASSGISTRLRRQGLLDPFSRELDNLLAELDQSPLLTDYAQRRSRYLDWDATPSHLTELADTLGRPITEGEENAAKALLWEGLTGQSAELHPIYTGGGRTKPFPIIEPKLIEAAVAQGNTYA